MKSKGTPAPEDTAPGEGGKSVHSWTKPSRWPAPCVPCHAC